MVLLETYTLASHIDMNITADYIINWFWNVMIFLGFPLSLRLALSSAKRLKNGPEDKE